MHLHGKFVVHPLDGRKVPIIQDAELVDMSFGTGAVKITPAHDPNDYATGKRHNLDCINILDDDGRINAHGGQFVGQPRFQVQPWTGLSSAFAVILLLQLFKAGSLAELSAFNDSN